MTAPGPDNTESIYIGSSTCGPYTQEGVTPLASGKGVCLGLGLLAAGGVAVGTVRVRRRRVLDV
jgi:hypothetical protein